MNSVQFKCLGYSRTRDAISDHVYEEDKCFIKSGELPLLNLE